MLAGAPQADLLFDNGPVFTADGAPGPVCQPVAVGDGRILAVGPRARDLAGPRTSGSTWPGGCSPPDSRTRTSTRSSADLSWAGAISARSRTCRTT